MEIEILKSVSFSIPEKTLLDEALRKFKLIEESTEKEKSSVEMRKLRLKLINLCYGVTTDMGYMEKEIHEIVR